jgi:hypothetical protein
LNPKEIRAFSNARRLASSGAGNYDALFRAIAARVAAGVDVRLIQSLE